MKRRHGLLGLFSLIGVWGLLACEPELYPFLGFALFFEYFFVEADEMFVANLHKAAAWAFFASLAVSAAATLMEAVLHQLPGSQALRQGIGLGFGCSVLVFCLASAYFDWKDRRGLSHD